MMGHASPQVGMKRGMPTGCYLAQIHVENDPACTSAPVPRSPGRQLQWFAVQMVRGQGRQRCRMPGSVLQRYINTGIKSQSNPIQEPTTQDSRRACKPCWLGWVTPAPHTPHAPAWTPT